jgi:hypothetical protein
MHNLYCCWIAPSREYVVVDGRDTSWLMPCTVHDAEQYRVFVDNFSGLDAAVSCLCQQFHNAHVSVSEFIVSSQECVFEEFDD